MLSNRLTLGRSPAMDVVIEDPYISREHCTLELAGEGVLVDASKSLNRVRANGLELQSVVIAEPGSFIVGQTTVSLRPVAPTEDTTLLLGRSPGQLSFRRSTRELFAPDGTLIAQLSTAEGSALCQIAARYPDAADHDSIGQAIWGEGCYDRYLIHRLVQRLRDRMGDYAAQLENVRGAGYRLRAPLELR